MAELFKYQIEGAEWLSKRKFGVIADEMGVGKTAQVVRALDLIGAVNILVVCPSSVRGKWRGEFEQWSTQERKIRIFNDGKQGDPTSGVTIISYNLLDKYKLNKNWDATVFDESHFLKNPEAKRTKIALGSSGIVHRSKRIYMMSGTPMPNHAGELWAMLFIFGATKLKYESFVKKFCKTYYYMGRQTITGSRTEMFSELKQILKPIMIRRRKKDVLKDLPPITYSDMLIEPNPNIDLYLDSDTAGVYLVGEDRTADFHRDMENEKNIFMEIVGRSEPTLQPKYLGQIYTGKFANVLPEIQRTFGTLRRFMGIQKIEFCINLVEKILQNDKTRKVVVFGCHRAVLFHVYKGLKQKKHNPVLLWGGSSAKKRERSIDAFQNNDKCRVFIGQVHAAGTGIDLTAGNVLIFVELDWVPGNNAQACMRIHRIGQEHKCTVINLVLDHPVDRRVSQVLRQKTKEILGVMGAVPVSQSERRPEMQPEHHIPIKKTFKDREIPREEVLARQQAARNAAKLKGKKDD